MIKEFWNERRQEKKRLKSERKANRKNPKTKEQIAYKIFGVFFALFIIFGSFGYSCARSCSGGYSWDSLAGIDDEIKIALSEPVDESLLIPSGRLNEYDWSSCIDTMTISNIDIVTDFKLDNKKLNNVKNLEGELQFTNRQLGSLICRYFEDSEYQAYTKLLDMNIMKIDDQYYLKSVILLSLNNYIGSNLPDVYLQTTSTISIYDKCCFVANSVMNVNHLTGEINARVVNVLNNNILKMSFISNELISNSINSFASKIHANITLDECLIFTAK
jgi:hypothetical protein